MPTTASLRAALERLLDSDENAVSLEDDSRAGLVRFVELLAKWNRVWNLTAVRDPIAMLERHVIDCLTLLPFVDEALDDARSDTGAFDLLDIGSGAGLPVLPLAIARPGLRCLSIERTGKKARFQQQVVLELGLGHVDVRAARIEDIDARALIVTSRAFTAPGDFLALAAQHVTPGGRALVMLGRAERLPAELPESFRLESLVRIDGTSERHLAICTSVY